MTSSFDQLLELIRHELSDAQRSRARGNEGRARVCARRAAGWAVGWYVETHSLAESHTNALQHLRWLVDQTEVDDELRRAADRLTTKVDQAGQLPFSADPIEDAKRIIKEILDLDSDSVQAL